MIRNIKELFQYRYMLYSLVKRDLRAKYKGTILGFLWTFFNPLLQLLVYSIVFPFLLRGQIKNYSMFLFVALLPWTFHATSMQMATLCIINNATIIKKIYFPRMVLPISVVFTNLINYLLGLLVVFFTLFILQIPISVNILFLPLIILLQFFFSVSIAIILSTVQVRFRDLEYIIGIFTMVWFYLTPIVYDLTMLPKEALVYFQLNPLTGIINAYRDVILYSKAPAWSEISYVIIVDIVLLGIAFLVFRHFDYDLAEEL